jgi:uncharacterized protein YbbC (DUF1343 family)/CubicO group peptidase (beta-lactamase class C family)
MHRRWIALWFAAFCGPAFCQSQTFSGAAELDAAVNRAIREDKTPGAVVLVGQNGHVVYRKAYGYRALVPVKERMTADTIFDIASLTKIVATTSAAMKLVEEGKLRIDDPVTRYLPEFQAGAKSQDGAGTITVRDLMTHFSGLRPDLDLEPPWSGYETGIRKALADKPANPPETKFIYSDINFVLLGEIVHRLSGLPENEYVKKILFDQLGMKETTYLPSPSLKPRIAPTEKDARGRILRGVVDDPTARYMGGVAGHAGVFSTAADLAKFCQMILDGGDGIFDPATIRTFTTSQSPANQSIRRGLGWDIDSPYSRPRGALFPIGSFGHTGFTGTSFWIDPASNTYVILLTNSIHPHRRPAITPLRSEVATIVARSAGYSGTRTGLDVLEDDGFRIFQGKRVGLITNQTGVDGTGRRNVDVMKAAGVNIVALFSPEHGIAGVEDREGLDDAIDKKTGIKVWSLYGKTRRPTPEMLRPLLMGNGALVFDIQDVGARFYTYESTMHFAMQEAAKAKLPFYVLDRPNPITGTHVEGPMLDADKLSFTGSFPLPLRHGMTIGELAALMNADAAPKADLHVIEMKGWHRADWFDQTGLPWVNPSPNIQSLSEALLYPGIAMIEHSTNYSVGRGTDAPFEQIGADWIDPAPLVARLKSLNIPGVECAAEQFRPASSNFSGRTIGGVRFTITNRDLFDSSRLGLAVAASLQALYPGKIVLDLNRDLVGNAEVLRALASGTGLDSAADAGLREFLARRSKFLIYQ